MTAYDWMWIGVGALLGATTAYAIFAVKFLQDNGCNEDAPTEPFNQDAQPVIDRLDHLVVTDAPMTEEGAARLKAQWLAEDPCPVCRDTAPADCWLHNLDRKAKRR